MNEGLNLVVAVAIAIGVVGVVVPVLPGVLLVWAAILLWSTERHDGAGWIVLAIVTVVLGSGLVAKYALPGRQLGRAGIPTRTTIAGAALGVIGFVVVPVIGLPLGFVLGVYLAERARLGSRALAWPSTGQALRAAGWSVLIELTTAVIMAVSWITAVIFLARV